MIRIEHVRKNFRRKNRDIAVLDDINCEVKEHEFVSIVGPSGCGKTTLLNIIAGLEKPTSGRVLINGEEVSSTSLDIGVCFQEAPLFPWKTVLENVELALKVRNKKDTKSGAKDHLKAVGLLDFADFYPKELSGGMKQKAALARALALEPKTLLMDEPFGDLDAQTRALMQEELLKIRQNYGKTVLLVTHSIDEAVFLSDRIVVFSSLPGKIMKIVDVDLPERSPEIRSEARFSQIRYRIWEMVRSEILSPNQRQFGQFVE
jgi:NitT/TauT family transport system ATP-binding protein